MWTEQKEYQCVLLTARRVYCNVRFIGISQKIIQNSVMVLLIVVGLGY